MEYSRLVHSLAEKLPFSVQTTSITINVLLILFGMIIALVVARRVILRLVKYLAKRSTTDWDDIIVERGVFDGLAYLAPMVVAFYGGYLLDSVEHEKILHRFITVAVIIIFISVAGRLLNAFNDIYNSSSAKAKAVPIKGYLQIAKLAIYLIGGIVVFGIVLDKSPWGLLSGLGAMTAVILLVFRDTILSFVASIQIASNDMVRIGDWVSMPKYDADGDVIDIALHTVKIQNWDKTITTVPTHRFIEESFKNWRGMQESGGRRIMRSVTIDIGTIGFLSKKQIEEISEINLLKDYMQQKKDELAKDPSANDKSPLNGRKLTNIGSFRAYVVEYLRAHPQVNLEMTFLIRQLAPTDTGVPIQIYLFSKEQRWVEYEDIQGDVFDHLLAAAPVFGLSIYQKPSSADFRNLRPSLN